MRTIPTRLRRSPAGHGPASRRCRARDVQPCQPWNTAGSTGKRLARRNSTEVDGRIDGKWKIAHSHWPYVKPELKQSNPWFDAEGWADAMTTELRMLDVRKRRQWRAWLAE